jgi:hypothetical protein
MLKLKENSIQQSEDISLGFSNGCDYIKHLEKEYPELKTDRFKTEKKRRNGFEYVLEGFIIVFKLIFKIIFR